MKNKPTALEVMQVLTWPNCAIGFILGLEIRFWALPVLGLLLIGEILFLKIILKLK